MSSPSLVIMLLLMKVLMMVTVLVSVEALRSVAVEGTTGRNALGRRPFNDDETTLELSELSESTSDSKENTGLIIPCSGAGWRTGTI